MIRSRNQDGQAIVVTVVFLTLLMGMAALVIDVGTWYRSYTFCESSSLKVFVKT